jgi:hypothetical protein
VSLATIVAASPCSRANASGWSRVETEHFVLTTDGPQRKAEAYAWQIEAFRHVGLLMLGVEPAGGRAQSKFDIFLLRRMEEMRKVRPDFSKSVAGVHFSCAEGSLAYATLQEKLTHDDSDPGLAVLLHEYAHHLMAQSSPAYYPMWYVEGFAEYMSTAHIEEGEVSLGYPSHGRVWTLKRDSWLRFEDVLAQGYLNGGSKDDDDERVYSFYAQSWLLAHYMLNDSDRTKKFNAYFARLAAGEDPVAAFEPATGIPVRDREPLLKRYLESLPVVTVSSKDIPNATPNTQAMPEAADDYLLNASLLRTCLARPQGEVILAQLRTLAGGDGGASSDLRLARDRAEILFGDPRTASEDLGAHASADEGSFEAHYLLGRALMANAKTLEGEAKAAALDHAREQFLKAYRLRKADAPNLYYLSYALGGGGTNPNVVNAARGAHALAPDVYAYAIQEARVDLEAEQRGKAVQALTPLASNPHNAKGAARIRAVIAAIQAGKGRSEVDRLMDGAQ